MKPRTSKNENMWSFVHVSRSPLDCKEIQPVHPKGNQPWTFIRMTDAEAEAPIFWPPDMKRAGSLEKTLMLGDCGQEEKGMTENEMVGCHHWLNGYEFEQTLGDSEGQGSLVCCSPWGCKKIGLIDWTHVLGSVFLELQRVVFVTLLGGKDMFVEVEELSRKSLHYMIISYVHNLC